MINFNKRDGEIYQEKLPLLSEPVKSVYLDAATLSLMIVLRDS